MFGEFVTGGQFPRPEDVERLERYEEAWALYEGRHWDTKAAKRLTAKLAENNAFHNISGLSAEGVVFLVVNLPRLIVSKFADLQVLQTPIINLDSDTDEEALKDRLRADVPDLWARLHYAKQLQRALGDVVLTLSRDDAKELDLRVVDPRRWFPVLDESDPLTVVAHQIAWIEEHMVGKDSRDILRVDVCYPDRVERRAFLLESRSENRSTSGQEIKEAVTLGQFWPGLREIDTAPLGGLMSCVHLANGCLDPSQIFGRPEFKDSAALIDDINTRLSSWSDANDKVSNAPRIVPKSYLRQDEDGYVSPPSQYTRIFIGSGREDGEVPRYMEYSLDHATLKDQFEASMLALLVRHEMAPALLGLQFGRERESGEAKSLGMGTTEAATRRDLLQTQPRVDEALTVLARLAGMGEAIEVGTHWRVGLPKSQAELMAEIETKHRMGLMTRKDMLEALYPWWSPDQIDAKLEELDAERQADMQAVEAQTFGSRVG